MLNITKTRRRSNGQVPMRSTVWVTAGDRSCAYFVAAFLARYSRRDRHFCICCQADGSQFQNSSCINRSGSTGWKEGEGHFGAVPPNHCLCPSSENCAPKESNRPGATGMHFGTCAPPTSVSKVSFFWVFYFWSSLLHLWARTGSAP